MELFVNQFIALQINHHRYYFFLIFTLLFYNRVFSSSLNLTGIGASAAKQQLKPVTEIIAAEQTPPLTFLSYHNSPLLAAGASFLTAAVPEFQSVDYGYPNIWFAMSISPNLTIGANITGLYWIDDNIQAVGPFLNTVWGTPEKSVNAGFHFHNLKGPDDFHLTDVAFDVSRIVRSSKWVMGYGLTAHYFKIHLHVTDHADSSQNYKMTTDLNTIFFRYGIYRQIGKNVDIGSEFFLTTGNFISNLNLTFNF